MRKGNYNGNKSGKIVATLVEVSQEIDILSKNEKLLYEEIINFTQNLIYKAYTLLSDKNPKEYVHRALVKLLTGERKWYKDKHPDIMDAIRLAIKSEIENEKSLKTINKHEHGEGKVARFISIYNTRDDEDYVIEIRDETPSIEDNLNKEMLFGDIFNELEENGDLVGFSVLDELLKGNSNSQVAEKLGISVREVENALKRIKTIGRNLNKYNRLIN